MRNPAPTIVILDTFLMIFIRTAVTFPSRHEMEVCGSLAFHIIFIIINLVLFVLLSKTLKEKKALGGWKILTVVLWLTHISEILWHGVYIRNLFL